ncbi:MAG: prepilin-type N-terminal cleavage/methylation domain-containing protein [Acutalibacteraceae bacterium]
MKDKKSFLKKIINKKGFNLVEVVVTVALLAVVASLSVVGVNYLSGSYNDTFYDTVLLQSASEVKSLLNDYLNCAVEINPYYGELSKITEPERDIYGKKVYSVSEGDAVICLDKGIVTVYDVQPVDNKDYGNIEAQIGVQLKQIKHIEYIDDINFRFCLQNLKQDKNMVKLEYTVKSKFDIKNDDERNVEVTSTSVLYNCDYKSTWNSFNQNKAEFETDFSDFNILVLRYNRSDDSET